MAQPDISIVLGSLNRKKLLALTIRSIRENGFAGKIEIIVVDGGSEDGSCEWLTRQSDILTIVQPNYKIRDPSGGLRRAHTWGEFMNLAFKKALAPWIVMISDDLIVCPGALQSGFDQLKNLEDQGEKIGGGSFFWREYPRSRNYHVKLLPSEFVLVNHGFLKAEALKDVEYADETSFEFYGADGDLSMRLNLAGWRTVPLRHSFAEHLNHRAHWRTRFTKLKNSSIQHDMLTFEKRYSGLSYSKKSVPITWE